jgi:phosphoribosylformimino-5-aminoimidazole carboxamide ribotide isomerase
VRIIPAIDIMNGKCIRLTRGDFGAVRTYNNDPYALARTFEDHGLKYLHLVDLDGAREKKTINWNVLEMIAKGTSLEIDFGGGIKTEDEIRTAFNHGAKQVNIGSAAVIFPDLFKKWLSDYGTDKIILAADSADRKIKVSGWVQSTDIDVIDFIADWASKGVSYVSCTDISRDGTLEGPSVELYKEILSGPSVKLIASGGISSVADVKGLKEAGCEGAIIGKAIFEGKINLNELVELC